MSCEACEQAQEPEKGAAYYRWKNANIEIRGCDVHLREIFEALGEVQAKRREQRRAQEEK